ncbi:unnamed protein product [Heligmosomoides polygyrus]|uniref:YDG domain-containing protein n=1 Tax=Heligmosomoides polygyrus TaxID=6339 RepID=A0A183GJ34_HELPZ|nr:unnamed protein product [Heligmosomoides polygyrus]
MPSLADDVGAARASLMGSKTWLNTDVSSVADCEPTVSMADERGPREPEMELEEELRRLCGDKRSLPAGAVERSDGQTRRTARHEEGVGAKVGAAMSAAEATVQWRSGRHGGRQCTDGFTGSVAQKRASKLNEQQRTSSQRGYLTRRTGMADNARAHYMKYAALPELRPYSGKDRSYSVRELMGAFELKYPRKNWEEG